MAAVMRPAAISLICTRISSYLQIVGSQTLRAIPDPGNMALASADHGGSRI
jgi:hypothetical protein